MISIDGQSLNCLKIQQIAHGEPVALCQNAAQQMLRNTQQADDDRTVLEHDQFKKKDSHNVDLNNCRSESFERNVPASVEDC